MAPEIKFFWGSKASAAASDAELPPDILIENCTFTNNTGTGILLNTTSDSTVVDNVIYVNNANNFYELDAWMEGRAIIDKTIKTRPEPTKKPEEPVQIVFKRIIELEE